MACRRSPSATSVSRRTARCGWPRARATPVRLPSWVPGSIGWWMRPPGRSRSPTASAASSSRARSSTASSSMAWRASTRRPRAVSGSTRRRPRAGVWTRVLYPVPDPIENGAPRPESAVALQQHLQRRRDPAEHRRAGRHRQLRLARRRCLQRLLPVDRRRTVLRQGQSERRAQSAERRPIAVRLLRRRQSALRHRRGDRALHQHRQHHALGRLQLEQGRDGSVEQDRRLAEARRLGVGAEVVPRLSAGRAGLVQPGDRRRSERCAARLRRSRGNLRDAQRRRLVAGHRPVLELRVLVLVDLRRHQHVQPHHPCRSALDRLRERLRLRRQ